MPEMIFSMVGDDGQPFFPCGGCQVCHDLYGDFLDAVISGVTSCACQALGGASPDITTSFTGVNGSFTATWDALRNEWVATNIGTLTLKTYDSVDGTCTDEADTFTAQVDLHIACNNNILGAFATTGSIGPLGTSTLFQNLSFAIDDVAPNTLNCFDDAPIGQAFDGNITVTTP